jgi:hypothetical protein
MMTCAEATSSWATLPQPLTGPRRVHVPRDRYRIVPLLPPEKEALASQGVPPAALGAMTTVGL